MIKVIKAGFFTSIQDRGRDGFASIGVPVSGVMDSFSSNLANNVLNNTLDDAVLEITFSGCKLEFFTETIICISGGNFSPKINNKSINLNSRIKVFKNDILSFGKINSGVRCYLAVKGGFLTDKVLNSRSFYSNVTHQLFIKKGDMLPISSLKSDLKTSNSSIKNQNAHFQSQEIACNIGPEFNLLNVSQKKQLESQLFTISIDNNRMGYRLVEIIENNLPQILTSAVLPGTVQLTPSGKLIVLMKDCQVTGGYPRVLQLTNNSISKLSQKTTNEKFFFVFGKH
ncbi:biotin-dependent carboxyltransferase family protein [uncultured Polaribacter sp.]|uniref:5-oxoprolinase subunit C family protein n=1 Tax=uncultured Polaribacter sp. TaxID=174711 RepID=UPI002639FEA4|nr:biotin-dependent carboxyltransferase family protein [uncultured Polaribacter sp.]